MVRALLEIIEAYEEYFVSERTIKELVTRAKEIYIGTTAKSIEHALQIMQFTMKLFHGGFDDNVFGYFDRAVTGTRISIKTGTQILQFESSKERNKIYKEYLLFLEELG